MIGGELSQWQMFFTCKLSLLSLSFVNPYHRECDVCEISFIIMED